MANKNGNKKAETAVAPKSETPVAPVAKKLTVTANGQNYPRENTIGWVIWQVINKMEKSGALPTGKQLLAVPEIQQYKPLSITATLAHYRKFYGIRGSANVKGATLAPVQGASK